MQVPDLSGKPPDTYYITVRAFTGKSHMLKSYMLMVYAQRSQVRNFRRLARSHGYSVSTSLSRSLAVKNPPQFSSHGFPKHWVLHLTTSNRPFLLSADENCEKHFSGIPVACADALPSGRASRVPVLSACSPQIGAQRLA